MTSDGCGLERAVSLPRRDTVRKALDAKLLLRTRLLNMASANRHPKFTLLRDNA